MKSTILELRLGSAGIVEGRIVYETSMPAASRATRISLRQRLLPVSPLYPFPESAVDGDGRFRLDNALGSFDFEVPGLRVVRVTQHGRDIANARIRVGPDESITGLEVTVGN